MCMSITTATVARWQIALARASGAAIFCIGGLVTVPKQLAAASDRDGDPRPAGRLQRQSIKVGTSVERGALHERSTEWFYDAAEVFRRHLGAMISASGASRRREPPSAR